MQEFSQVLPIFRQNRPFPAVLPAFLVISACLAACGKLDTDRGKPQPGGRTISRCAENGYFKVEAFGAVTARIDWDGDSLACEGMPRPRGQGARLRFAGDIGPAAEQHPFAIILSIPELNKGRAANELPTRVTLIEGNDVRFFSTQDSHICWSDVSSQSPVQNSNGTADADI